MAEPKEPPLVKLIIAVLYVEQEACDAARDAMLKLFGNIDYASETFAFDFTDYYAEEMGQPLLRIFFGFEKLIDPGSLVSIKLATIQIEAQFSQHGRRRVNLDPGYLDTDKFILASAKANAQKIYLAHGIWADPTLRYEKGRYLPFPWSFPDFRSERYQKTFMRLRDIYKKQRPH
jgi:hypothetical protein